MDIINMTSKLKSGKTKSQISHTKATKNMQIGKLAFNTHSPPFKKKKKHKQIQKKKKKDENQRSNYKPIKRKRKRKEQLSTFTCMSNSR